MNEHKSRYMANLLQHSILSGDILYVEFCVNMVHCYYNVILL